MKYLIIGNSVAAVGAVEGIRRIDSESPVTMIADEPYPAYSRPLISYYLEDKVSENEMGYREADFYNKNRVNACFGVRATQIHPDIKQVCLDNGEMVSYDRLLIATGSRPVLPPLKGLGDLEKEGVFFFNRLDDVKALRSYLRTDFRVAVVGAGLTGLKAAEALVHKGMRVTVADIAPFPLSAILDEVGAAIVQRHLEKAGIEFRMGVPVVEIVGDNKVSGLALQDGSFVPSDAVIIAAGVQPNLELVENTGISINRGILVDNYMRTSLPDIYAAGDVSEGWDLLLRKRRIIATLPNAYRQGEVAGQNMAGRQAAYAGGIPMNSVNFFGLPVVTAGLSNYGEGEHERLTIVGPDCSTYRSVTFQGNRLVGYICIGDINRTGILTALIRSGAPTGSIREKLLTGSFGLIDLPEEVRFDWQWERGELTWKPE